MLALVGVGLFSGAIVGRAPAAGARAAAVQKLQVLPAGPGDIAVTLAGKAEQQCFGPDGAGQDVDCHYDVEPGATVTLEAKPHSPEEGRTYSFVRWSDGDCWTTNPCKFVMPNEPASIAAIFSPAEVQISIAGNVGSRITGPAPPGGKPIDCQLSDNGGGPCFGWFPVGTPITLKVESGNFTAWHRYCEGSEKTCSFVTAGYAWINAEFDHLGGDGIPQKLDAPLKVMVSGGGNVTSSRSQYTAQSINCPATCAANYTFGEPVVLTAASGAVASWGKACAGAPTTCAIAAGTYREVVVAFAAPPATTTTTTTTTTSTATTATTATTTVATTTKKPPVAQRPRSASSQAARAGRSRSRSPSGGRRRGGHSCSRARRRSARGSSRSRRDGACPAEAGAPSTERLVRATDAARRQRRRRRRADPQPAHPLEAGIPAAGVSVRWSSATTGELMAPALEVGLLQVLLYRP